MACPLWLVFYAKASLLNCQLRGSSQKWRIYPLSYLSEKTFKVKHFREFYQEFSKCPVSPPLSSISSSMTSPLLPRNWVKLALYADDTVIYFSYKNLFTIHNTFQFYWTNISSSRTIRSQNSSRYFQKELQTSSFRHPVQTLKRKKNMRN